MSILKANLKHLYQRRGLWAAYLLFGCFVAASIEIPLKHPEAGQGTFIGLVALAFVVGLLAATVQMEVLTKPFAFCLPGHRRMVGRFIFLVGIVSNGLGCLLFLFYPGVPVGYLPVVLCSAFGAGLTSYLAGVWVAFSSGQPLAFIGFLALAFVGGQAFSLHVLLEKAIVEVPWLTTASGLVVAELMWRYLHGENLARKNSLRPLVGLDAVFNPEKNRRLHQTRAGGRRWEQLKDHPRLWVQRLFLGHMNRHGFFSTVRFVWGSLYTTYAIVISRWRGVLWFTLFLSIFLGYMGARMWAVALFGPLMMLAQTRPSLYSAMPIAGGRGQRLVSTLVTAGVGWLLAALGIGLAILVSVPLATVAPDIEYRGLNLEYQTVSPQVFWVLVFLPLVYALRLVFFKRPVAMMVAFIATIYFIMFTSLAGRRGPFTLPGAQIAAPLTILLWVIFAGIVYHIARRRNLVR